MNYKEENCRAYDQYTDAFDAKFERHFGQNVQPKAEAFLEVIPGKRILDLGSGPGNHARFFVSRGYDVLCADLSEKMVAKCLSKGLKALLQDMESMSFAPASFDGIWVYASLLHVPKDKVPDVIDRLADALIPSGVLGLAVKEGQGEEWEVNEKYPGTNRRFSYFEDEEIKRLFQDKFELLASGRAPIKNGEYYFLDYLFRKRV